MKNNIPMEELIKKYQEVCEEQIKKEKLKHISLDLQSFVEFYKGINIAKCFVGENKKWDTSRLPYTIDDALEVINNGETVAYFDNNYCEIISREKKVSISKFAANYQNDEERIVRNIEVTQITSDGIYHIFLNPYEKSVRLYYCLNDALLPLADNYGCTVEEYKFNFLHNNERQNGRKIGLRDMHTAYMTDFDMECSDLPILANILFHSDLSSICKQAVEYQHLKNKPFDKPYHNAKDYFSITDEAREFFKLTEREKETIQNVQSALEEKKLQDIEETSQQLESGKKDKLSTISSEKKNKIVEKLILLRDTGCELTEEQQTIIELYEKLNSEKFQQYKKESQTRKARQEEVRNKIAVENEKKENWYNSPDNPTNKRIEELKHIKKQIQALESLSKIDDSLLSTEQRELIEHGKIFFDMLNTTQSLEHEVDTGMNPEIRSWYQDFYSNEEGKSRK